MREEEHIYEIRLAHNLIITAWWVHPAYYTSFSFYIRLNFSAIKGFNDEKYKHFSTCLVVKEAQYEYKVWGIVARLFYFIFNSFLKRFIYFRERESWCMGQGERERRSSFSTEQGAQHGLDLRTLRSWPEPKPRIRHKTDWTTQAPLSVSCFKITFLDSPSKFKKYFKKHFVWLWLVRASIE